MELSLVAPARESYPLSRSSPQGYQIHNLAHLLIQRGHRVRLYASHETRSSAALRTLKKSDCQELLHSLSPSVRVRASQLLNIVAQRELFALALRDSNDSPPDLIHLHHPTILDYVSFASCPIVCTVHFGVSDDDLELFGTLYHYYGGFPMVTFVAVSSHQLRRLRLSFRTFHNACVIHNGIDVAPFPCRQENPPEDGYVLFVGRMSQEKAPHKAIAAAKRAGVTIHVCGTYSADREGDPDYFIRYIAPSIDGRTVIYHGEVDYFTRNRLLVEARALLFTSDQSDAFGVSMLESMACGVPVVAFNQGSAVEIVRTGISGYLVSDEIEMADVIHTLQPLHPLQIRSYVEEHFGFGKMVDDYEKLYARVVDTASRTPGDRVVG